MWYVYVLLSQKDNHLYIGMSENPRHKLIAHNNGVTHSTKNRRPFVLIYTEKCGGREKARIREKFLKSGCGREFVKQFIPR